MSTLTTAQEELLANLTMMGYPSAHVKTAIASNPNADLSTLLDWLGRNPAPFTPSPPSRDIYSDDQIKKLAKEAQAAKNEKVTSLIEMGFSKTQAIAAMEKLSPHAALDRLASWIMDSKLSDTPSGPPKKDSSDWVLLQQKKKKKKKPTTIMVGTKVRIKPGIVDPKHGWGSVTQGEVGVVKRTEKAHDIWVDFSKQLNWHGERDEMDIATDGEEDDDDDEEQPGIQRPLSGDRVEVMPIDDDSDALDPIRGLLSPL